MIQPSDYDLINSLVIKDLIMFYESMSVSCMVEYMLYKHDKEQINMSYSKDSKAQMMRQIRRHNRERKERNKNNEVKK